MNINGYSALFSSLSGQYNIQDSFANLYNNYRQIKQGSYGHLMKAYVGKVGNQAALKAFPRPYKKRERRLPRQKRKRLPLHLPLL